VPHRNITRNVLDWIVAAALSFYLLLVLFVPVAILVQTLNSILVGTLCAVAFVYRGMLKALFYNRDQVSILPSRLWALGSLGWPVAIMIRNSGSIVNNVAGGPQAWTPVAYMITISSYIAICSGIAQVLAQKMEGGYFHGEDKLTVWAALLGGGIIAVLSIYAQVNF
jgi:hypothetical protein